MLKPFASSRLLIERAVEHQNQFEFVQRTFVAKNPYTRLVGDDPKTGDHLLKVRVEDPPAKLSPIAFDIVNCLRSALDHAVFDSAREIGGNPNPKHTKFPFGKDAAGAARDLERHKDIEVPPAIRPYLLGFEPYEGGKHAIWELNEIRNGKIHRILQSTAVVSEGIGIYNGIFGHAAFTALSDWDDESRELTYGKIGRGAKMRDVDIRPTIDIAFGDVPFFGRTSARQVLRKFRDAVHLIVEGIEAETARIKGG